MADEHSYGQILRSSAVIGGAQAINYLLGLARSKAVAVLLGPSGVGIIGLYSTAMSLLGSITDLGLKRSSVRAIALAQGQGDPLAVARTARTLRRLCWATGILGWMASLALAIPLSHMMFESAAHAWALAILGGTLLLGAINGGQLGLLQGLRRIGDIARVQVISALASTVLTIALYAWLRERGIVPVLIASAAVSLSVSWWFARRIEVPPVAMTWGHAMAEARPMLGLGAALMSSSTFSLLLELYTRSLLSRGLGLDAAGLYQAAWSLSGVFARFVLSAMGTDFYPRLTAVIHDRAAASREINEQTEIGILLVLPGLLATLTLAEWLLWALYSAEFRSAASALVWMLLGVYINVLAWPLGYMQLALGATKWYLGTELLFIAIQGALVTWMVPRSGVLGAAYAFFAGNALYLLAMLWVGRRLIGFRHSPAATRLIAVSALLVALALAANRWLPGLPSVVLGGLLALVGGLWCLRALAERLGPDHRLTRLLTRVPGLGKR